MHGRYIYLFAVSIRGQIYQLYRNFLTKERNCLSVRFTLLQTRDIFIISLTLSDLFWRKKHISCKILFKYYSKNSLSVYRDISRIFIKLKYDYCCLRFLSRRSVLSCKININRASRTLFFFTRTSFTSSRKRAETLSALNGRSCNKLRALALFPANNRSYRSTLSNE